MHCCDITEVTIKRNLHTNYIRFSGAQKEVIAECFEEYIELRQSTNVQNIPDDDIIEIVPCAVLIAYYFLQFQRYILVIKYLA